MTRQPTMYGLTRDISTDWESGDSGLSCLAPENCEGRVHSRSLGFLEAFLGESLLPDSHWMGPQQSTGIWRLETWECDLRYRATVSLGRGPF